MRVETAAAAAAAATASVEPHHAARVGAHSLRVQL